MAPRPFVAARTEVFSESVIREMTRLALEHGAINLAQGFPDFPAPDFVKRAAIEAIAADVNQYAITWAIRVSATPSRRKSGGTTASKSTPSARSRSPVARLKR